MGLDAGALPADHLRIDFRAKPGAADHPAVAVRLDGAVRLRACGVLSQSLSRLRQGGPRAGPVERADHVAAYPAEQPDARDHVPAVPYERGHPRTDEPGLPRSGRASAPAEPG